MAQPEVYDLSYRMNLSGLFIPDEYVSNFVAGEVMFFGRTIINAPKPVVGVKLFVKPTKGSDQVLIVKNPTTTVIIPDGTVSPLESGWAVSIVFFGNETALMDEQRYFVVEVQFNDGSSIIMGQGYFKGGLAQSGSSGTAIDILIRNLPGSTSIGQLQIDAVAVDEDGNIVPGVPILFFSSNNALATVSDSGLVAALALGTVNITAATTQGNISKRATLVIT